MNRVGIWWGSSTLVLVALAEDAELSAAVPTCPGWSVADLLGHLGGVHRWVLGILASRERAPFPDPPDDGLVAWFQEGARLLVDGLAGEDPASVCWTFAPPHEVGWWTRRQLHEALVHRCDLEAARGLAHAVDPRTAADGVDEVVTMFWPRQVRLGRELALTDALELVDSGSAARWVLAGDGTGGAPQPDATLSGDAGDLLLALWKRGGLDRLELTGDVAAAQCVLSARLTP